MVEREPAKRNKAEPDSTLLSLRRSASPADRCALPLVEAGWGSGPPGSLQGSFEAE